MGIWANSPLVVLLAAVGWPLAMAGRHPGADGPHMLGIAMRLGWEVRSGQLFTALDHASGLVAPHPPGAYLPVTLLYALLGPLETVPVLAGLCWLGLLMMGGMRMLRRTPGRAWVMALGLAAVPLVWHQLDNYGVDLASAAMVSMALSWLMASDGLTERRASLWAGVWIGAGFWVKYTFPIFLFVPCVLVLLETLWVVVRRQPDARARIENGLWLTGGLLLVVGPLMLLSGSEIANYVFHSASLDGQDETVDNLGSSFGADVSPFDVQMFYSAVLKDVWGWPGLALLATGLLVGLWQLRHDRSARRDTLLCLASIVSSYLVLAQLNVKADRYLLPMMAPLLMVGLVPLAGGLLRPLLPIGVLAVPVLFLWRDFSGWTQGMDADSTTLWGPTASGDRFAPSGRQFEHTASVQLAQWGRWPRVEEAFRPIHVPVDQWNLSAVVQEMHRRAGPDAEVVGLCLTERAGTPGFGLFLMEAEKLGYHWDFASVMVLRGAGASGKPRTFQFRGPFMAGEDDTSAFDVLFVSYQTSGHSPQRNYLESLSVTDAESFRMPGGLGGQVVTLAVADAPPVQTEGSAPPPKR
ncbi:MAG TPA: hypothetical protein DFR83_13580 [Deltaproteobacteria bacterium]|nr:hypothetical protein [Deltaproteobacteria bacterium]